MLPIIYGKENYTVGEGIRVIVEPKSVGVKRDKFDNKKIPKIETA